MKKTHTWIALVASTLLICATTSTTAQPIPGGNRPPAPSNQSGPPPRQQPQNNQNQTPRDNNTPSNPSPSDLSPGTSGSDQAYEGLNLFAPLGSKETYLMDNQGNIVKTWSSDYGPALSVYLLGDGSLLRTCNVRNDSFDAGGAGGRIEWYNSDGSLRWGYDLSSSTHCQHHDIEMLPNGNILAIVWEKVTQAEAIAAGRDPNRLSDGELWVDTIYELEPIGTSEANLVWKWNTWDHLVQEYDSTKPNFGSISEHPEKINLNYTLRRENADWHHINSVDYHPGLDQIILSVHNFSEIWIIDHSTTTAQSSSENGGTTGKGGDLLYRWGNPAAYDRGDAGDQTLFAQHDAEWITTPSADAGDILIFNNGQGRADGNYSSVDQITPPVQTNGTYSLMNGAAYGPSSLKWSYASPNDFYAQRISGSQRLANGNTLICEGTEGRFFEVTDAGELVWQYNYNGEVFRVDRLSYAQTGLASGEPESNHSTPSIPGTTPTGSAGAYPIVDTGQRKCFNIRDEINAPASGEDFYGQDAQYAGNQPAYVLSGDGLLATDQITGLTWTTGLDYDNDGEVDANDKKTYSAALAYANTLNENNYGGYNDWRLPSIKELYSLMDFSGEDISGPTVDINNLHPFINVDYFDFAYGDESAGERLIDSQFASTTIYQSTVMNGQQAMFGLNLADGRIKGYPTNRKTFFVYYVRGNTDYGKNAFVDNGNSTVSDTATGLMWTQNDSGDAMSWQQALSWVQARNAENYLGYSDWRLPNAKELHSIVDYSRSPDTTASAAIDPVFNCTPITNELGQSDFPWYWTNTTHKNSSQTSGPNAVYICFGRGMGYMNGSWMDVHGAGCQRSDQKSESTDRLTYINDGYYFGNAPQGDATRIYNFVRMVRN